MNAPFISSRKFQLFLLPFAKLYELVIRLRLAFFRAKIFQTKFLATPVISIGNITVGGTGKTPCTAYIANFLQQRELRVAILSRGYKRTTTGIVEVSDGKNILCEAHQAGDEPYLLAQKCPSVSVIVNADRYAAGKWLAAKNKVDVFLLDDGYQHIQLGRNLNLLLLDATEPQENYELLPAGKLREPLFAIKRADAVILTRSDQAKSLEALQSLIQNHCRRNTPIFLARHKIAALQLVNSISSINDLTKVPVAALSCIAKPESFLHSLAQQNLNVIFQQNFSDHHRYSTEEFLQFVAHARAAQATAIITTEKDIANIPVEALQTSSLPVYVTLIQFVVDNDHDLQSLILQAINP